MTKKELDSLKVTIIGAAIFVGGCVWALADSIGLLAMSLGFVTMMVSLIMGSGDSNDNKNSEEKPNEPN